MAVALEPQLPKPVLGLGVAGLKIRQRRRHLGRAARIGALARGASGATVPAPGCSTQQLRLVLADLIAAGFELGTAQPPTEIGGCGAAIEQVEVE